MRVLVDTGDDAERLRLRRGDLCTMVGQRLSDLVEIRKRFVSVCFLDERALADDLGDQGAPRCPDSLSSDFSRTVLVGKKGVWMHLS